MKPFKCFQVGSAVLVPKPGKELPIDWLVFEAISFARLSTEEESAVIRFNYKSVAVSVTSASNQELIVRDWWRAVHGYIIPSIGPWPTPKLSQDELDRQETIKAANDMLFNSDGIKTCWGCWEISMKEAFKNPIRHAAFTYAERWARIMQLEVEKNDRAFDHSFNYIVVSAACMAGFPTSNIIEASQIWDEAVNILIDNWGYGSSLAQWLWSEDLQEEIKRDILRKVYPWIATS